MTLWPNANLPQFRRRMFVWLLLLGFVFRIGYGVVRYRSTLHTTGPTFINLWNHDAYYHVLIAKALLTGKGYVVDDTSGRLVRYAGQPALFKAPFYEFFLAGIFAVSGFSFKLFFPFSPAGRFHRSVHWSDFAGSFPTPQRHG